MIRKLRCGMAPAAGRDRGLPGFCVPLHYLWKLFGARSPWPRIFLGWTGRRCGPAGHGSKARRCPPTCSIVANHVSWLDILALGGAVAGDLRRQAPTSSTGRCSAGCASLNDTRLHHPRRRSSVRGQAEQLRDGARRAAAPSLCSRKERPTPARECAAVPPQPVRLALSRRSPGVMVQPVALDFGAPRRRYRLDRRREPTAINCQDAPVARPAGCRSRCASSTPIDPARGRRPQARSRAAAREAIVAALEASADARPHRL